MKNLKLNHRYLVIEEEGDIQEWKVIEISKFAYKIQDNTDYSDEQGIGVDWVLKETLAAQKSVKLLEDLGLELPHIFSIPNSYITNNTGTPYNPTPPSTCNNDLGDGGCGGDCVC